MNYKLEKSNETEYFEVKVNGVSIEKGKLIQASNVKHIISKINEKIGK